MWSLRVFSTLALAAFTICTPITNTGDHASRAAGRHLTVGLATRSNGRPYLRNEVRDLKTKYPDQWNLFILATHAFRQMDANDPLSPYQILGIHGRPFTPWQEANGVANAGWKGYCAHGTPVFITWHRPYVALYEQELSKQVRMIAETATNDRDRWLGAADAFRMPYFDVGLGERGGELPDFFTTPYIQVTGPDGVPNVIPNPLYQYKFQPIIKQDFVDQWAQWNTTLRWPTSNAPDARSQPEKFRSKFYTDRGTYQSELGKIFQQTTFNEFAKELEQWHGWFHGLVGNFGDVSGHFWPVDYSAFDPIFMLHHANVDRLLALFQAMHPESWLEPADSGGGSLWVPAQTTIDASWGLQPFWKDDTTFYNSWDIRNADIFGYTYPETQSWNYASESDWRGAVTAYVTQTYTTAARAMLTANGAQGAGGLAHVVTNSTFTDWSITITASTQDLPGTFRVEFMFMVNNPTNLDVPVVGQWMQLLPLGTNKDWKVNAAKHNDKRFSTIAPTRNGTVSLTASLLDQVAAGELASLHPDAVVPYLQQHLAWRVTGDTDERLQDEDLDAFILDVVSTDVRIPDEPSQMLEYSGITVSHQEVMGSRGRLEQTVSD